MSEINRNITAKADSQMSQDDWNNDQWFGSEGVEDGTSQEIIVIEDADQSLTEMSQAHRPSQMKDFPTVIMDSDDDDEGEPVTKMVETSVVVKDHGASPTYEWCNSLLLEPKKLFALAFEGKGTRTQMVEIAKIGTLNLGRPTSIADAANLLNRFGERKEGFAVDDIWKWGKQFVENSSPAHAILLAPLPVELQDLPEHKGKDWVLVEGSHRVMIAKQW